LSPRGSEEIRGRVQVALDDVQLVGRVSVHFIGIRPSTLVQIKVRKLRMTITMEVDRETEDPKITSLKIDNLDGYQVRFVGLKQFGTVLNGLTDLVMVVFKSIIKRDIQRLFGNLIKTVDLSEYEIRFD